MKEVLEGVARKIPIGKNVLWWTLIFLASCGPATFDDLRFEGEAQIRLLAKELRSIETKEDLQRATVRLRKRYNKIADLLIEAKEYSCEREEDSLASEELFLELARIYEMPGGREGIEFAQSQAVHRLQAELNGQRE